MTDVCNIFKPLSNPDGNFLLFSQYTNDLARSTVDSSYRVVPSRFYCLDLSSDAILRTATKIPNPEPNSNYTLPRFLQNCFECGLSFSRTDFNNTTSFLVAPELIYKLNQLTETNEEQLNINKSVVYRGDIDTESWDKGFADIIINIPSNSSKIDFTVNDTIESYLVDGDIETMFGVLADEEQKYTYILGWDSKSNIPLSGEIYDIDTVSTEDILGEISRDSSVFDFLFDSNTSEDPDFKFNTIIPCYNVVALDPNTGKYEIFYKDVPMGIYFTGVCDETNNITNAITIHKSETDALGAGSSWSLRICTKFAPTPQGIEGVETIAVESGAITSSLSAIMSASAEMIKTVNDMSKKSWTDTQTYRDLLTIFKSGRTNVPYPYPDDPSKGTQYWYVNGRNTGIPIDSSSAASSTVSSGRTKLSTSDIEAITSGGRIGRIR